MSQTTSRHLRLLAIAWFAMSVWLAGNVADVFAQVVVAAAAAGLKAGLDERLQVAEDREGCQNSAQAVTWGFVPTVLIVSQPSRTC